ncbi:uncharacterized protein LOC116128617 isoform X2 [Pistacia vera]|uniref:uncharacterized protein LOC116128617 isoform X2 n=1 Tax=Pistacia vera TaxID=55513 RepID=UPI001263A9FE|nr:uncharacterized protein LOC116128617 isoform X2 [Pistacia vera]
MKTWNLVLLMLCVTVIAPIVLYTDRFSASFKASSSRNQFLEDLSAFMGVPLHTWVLFSNFKLAYNLLRRPDGTFNRHLAEFLDRKVPANANAVEGIVKQ